MMPQPVTNENIVIVTSNSIGFPHTEKPKPTNQSQDILKKYLKAELKVWGTLQILCGVMVLSLGVILQSASSSEQFSPVFSILLQAAYPFLGALCFVVSGSLSIITEKKSTRTWVQSSLAANILSCLSALLGFILLSVNLAALGPAFWNCDLSKEDEVLDHHNSYYVSDSHDRDRVCFIAHGLLAGILSLMQICNMLEFFLAVLMAMIWWKQAHSDFPGNVLFQSLNHRNKSDMVTKAILDPEYD